MASRNKRRRNVAAPSDVTWRLILAEIRLQSRVTIGEIRAARRSLELRFDRMDRAVRLSKMRIAAIVRER
jgi:hypothetical protein